MNLITRALQNISWNIPQEVLTVAFNRNYNGMNANILNEIEYKVIRPRVLVDCNIVGGTQLLINLKDCIIRKPYDGGMHVTVPKNIVNGRSIISVENIISTSYVYNDGQQTAGSCGSNQYLNQAYKMITNTESPPVDVSANITLIGENILFILDYPNTIGDSTITTIVSNMTNLENMPMKTSLDFSKLVQYAVEAYIYNELRIKADKGSIYQGHALSSLDSIIDSYSDANELYLEELAEVWSKVAFIVDTPRMAGYVKSMFGNV